MNIEQSKLIKHLQEVSYLALTEDFGELADYVVSAVEDLTEADVILRMVRDARKNDTQILDIVASKGSTIDDDFRPSAKLPFDPGLSINAQALTLGRPIIRHDVQNENEKPTFHYIEEARRRGWHSFLAVPLLGRDGERLGVLSLYSRAINRFGASETEVVQTFANQAAIAFQQQKRTFDLKRQTTELEAAHQTALNIIAHEDIQTLLEAIVEEATTLLNGKGGKIYLRVPGEKLVRLVAAKAVDPKIMPLNSVIPFGKGMAGKVITSKKPLIVHNYGEWKGRIKALTYLFTAVIEVPLITKGEAIGVLSVFDDAERRRFTEKDIPILERLAQQAALVIHNAELFDKYQNRVRLLNSLHNTSLDIIQEIERKELMQSIIDQARDLIAGDKHERIGAAYWRCDYANEQAIVEHSHSNKFKGLKVGFNESLIGQVIQTGKSHYKNGFDKWEDHATVFNTELIRYVKNVIEVPVKEEGRVIAVIAITDGSGDRPFDDEDIDLLERFANLATIAIQKARLFEKIQAQQEAQIRAIGQIAHSIAMPSQLDEVLEEILDSVSVLMGKVTLSEIKQLDKETNELFVRKYIGEMIEPDRRRPIGEGITGWAAQHQQTLLVSDVSKEPRYIKDREDTKSELAVPLVIDGDLIGVLNIENSQIDGFSEKDVQLAEAIAGLAVVALDNSALSERLESRASRLDYLRQTITAEHTNLEKVLQLIVNSLSNIFSGVPCVIRLYELEKDIFTTRVVATAEILENEVGYAPRSNGSSRYTIKSQEPYYIENAEDPVVGDKPAIRKELQKRGVKSMAVFPLLNQNVTVGVLSLYLTKSHKFSRNDRQIIELFANQAAVAIVNSELYGRIQLQREAEIQAIGDIATSIAINARVGLNEVLENIINSIKLLMGESNLFVVWLHDEDKHELFVTAIHGGLLTRSQRKKVGQGITGQVAETMQTVYVKDVREDDRYLPGLYEARSELAIPLKRGNNLIGVLNIEDPKVDAFSPTDIQLAEAIAALIVVAIENAESFELMERRVEQRTKDWQEQKEQAAAAEQLAMMGAVSTEFAHRMNNVAGTIPVRVAMAREILDHENQRDQKVIKQLDKIADETQQLLLAVQEIKHGTEVKTRECIDINMLIESALKRVLSAIPEHPDIDMQFELADDLSMVHAEKNTLLDTFVNIIRNSFTALNGKGELEIKTFQGEYRGKSCIDVVVRDNGKGISEENLQNIFTPFFTTDEKGLGFGLWRDITLIKALGGTIEVKSLEGLGATFIIKIPISPEEC